MSANLPTPPFPLFPPSTYSYHESFSSADEENPPFFALFIFPLSPFPFTFPNPIYLLSFYTLSHPLSGWVGSKVS